MTIYVCCAEFADETFIKFASHNRDFAIEECRRLALQHDRREEEWSEWSGYLYGIVFSMSSDTAEYYVEEVEVLQYASSTGV